MNRHLILLVAITGGAAAWAEPADSYAHLLNLISEATQAEAAGHRAAAVPAYEAAIGLCDTAYPDSAALRIRLRVWSANCYGNLLRRDRVEERTEEVAELVERFAVCADSLGPWILRSRAQSLAWDGKIAAAESLYDDLLDLDRQRYAEEPRRLLDDEFWWAMWLDGWGRLEDAERHYRNVLRCGWEVDSCSGHPNVSTVLLANVVSKQGRHAEAIQLISGENMLAERCPVSRSTDLARGYAAATEILARAGDTTAAQATRARAIDCCWRAIHERAEGGDGRALFVVGRAVSQLSRIREPWHDLAAEESLMCRVVHLTAVTNEPDWPDTYLWMAEVAAIAGVRGRFEAADSLYGVVLTFNERFWGETNPRTARVATEAALCALQAGATARAVELARSGYTAMRDLVSLQLTLANEHDALQMATRLEHATDTYLSALLAAERLAEACDLVLESKGNVMAALLARSLEEPRNRAPELEALQDSLRQASAQLSSLFVSGQATPGEVAELSETVQCLQAAIARQTSAEQIEWTKPKIGTAQVQAALPIGSALIEYKLYNDPTGDGEHQYVAVVIPSFGSSAVIRLGAAAGIDSVVQDYVTELSRPELATDAWYQSVSSRLRRRIWDPLAAALGDSKFILIAADGALNRVSFAGLQRDDAAFLVEEFMLHYVNSGRDLLRHRTTSLTNSGLLAMGDPDFDYSAAVGAQVAAADPRSSLETEIKSWLPRNVRSACQELDDLNVPRLPGTNSEITASVASWNRECAGPATLYVGREATEERLKRTAGTCAILHLATHGYYLDDDCFGASRGDRTSRETRMFSENPLLRSGVLLAGANHAAAADQAGVEDGVVTAEELATVDLSGTKLVILSSCESGLGDVQAGEGVMGLRWALQAAGARSVVCGLWSVHDEWAGQLTSGLFSAIARPLPERLRLAQLNFLDARRTAGLSLHPVNWAALISVGQWD